RRAILVEVMRGAHPDELSEILYFSQGLLRPEYEGIELGMADSLARRAVAAVLGVPEDEIAREVRTSGDLGSTIADHLASGGRVAGSGRSVREVYGALLALGKDAGEGSQDRKVAQLTDLLASASPPEAKYLVRFVLGKLRLGVREMTLVDAFAATWGGGTKEARQRIETAFNVSSDLGLVGETLARSGMEGLREITLTVGRPVRPMLAEREESLAAILERMEGRSALEYKYDGLRIQAHVFPDGTVRLFSRRLEEVSDQFPELTAELPKAISRRPAIVEGECVPIDPDTDEIRPFQEVSRRRGRKYDLERMQQEVPVSLFLFDVLLEGDRRLLDEAMGVRRRALEELVRSGDRIRIAEQRTVTTTDAAQVFFDESIARGCEGVVAKSLGPGSTYHPGGRGFWWIKYKREYTVGLADSIDGVVVGAFHGRGRRGGRFGALLMAVYNPDEDRYESFCKVGSGFDDAALAALPARLAPLFTDSPPEGVLSGIVPDQWIRPALVLEVRGAELSISPTHRAGIGVVRADAGLALRFPRFTGRYRVDKGPTDATTSAELVELYQTQVRHTGTAPGGSRTDEEPDR
ncbi:MAG TPA: ATP-dependent DNA ligase, partial [Thermoplasmata archaeon]|nr:ATP-dependent DNA ligase [Thermoplasmata archaeon]